MYVRKGAGGFYNFSKKKKKILAQGTIELNVSWSSKFFEKYFMGPPFNFSFLFIKACQCSIQSTSNIHTSSP